MNERQKKFAQHYAQSGNTVQSAIKAGYSDSYANKLAHKLLDNIGVAQYIKSLTEKAQEERILSALERQELLSNLAKDGEEKTADRIKAVDVLNRMTGEYLDKVEISGEVNTTGKLDKILEQLNKGVES